MHTYQILLTEADSGAQAKKNVIEFLYMYSDINGSWWDSFSGTSGGSTAGRWKHVICRDDVLSYVENTTKFNEIVIQSLESRYYYFDKHKARLDELGITLDSLNIRYPNREWKNGVYEIQSMIKTYSDDWTPDSGIYDTVSRDHTEEEVALHRELYGYTGWFTPTASLNNFEIRRKIYPEKQWLVVVDFHFQWV